MHKHIYIDRERDIFSYIECGLLYGTCPPTIQMFIILFLTNQPWSFELLFLRYKFFHNFVYCFILLAIFVIAYRP